MDPAHALWIGGPQGTGKSAVARALAQRFGLRLYAIDHHSGVHEPRMPRMQADPQRVLASIITDSRHRFRLVLEDLRALPDEPAAIVEGPQLLPTFVAAVLRHPDQAVFLLPEQGAGDLLVAPTVEREARELRLPVLAVDAPLEEMVERVAATFAPALARLSGATGTSP